MSAPSTSAQFTGTRAYQQATAAYIADRLPAEVSAGIRGNAPDDIKEVPVKWLTIFAREHYTGALQGGELGFGGQGGSMARAMRVTEVDILPKLDAAETGPPGVEGRVVVEIAVTPEMCDHTGVLAQGAVVFFIDECSTLSMVVANYAEGRPSPPGVSCTISVGFHGTARAGTTLRIVNRSLAVGRGVNSGRSDVWCTQQNKIIASGTQTTMPPSLL